MIPARPMGMSQSAGSALLSLAAVCAAAACGSSGKSGPSGADFAPLFVDQPDAAAPAPDSLDGLWAGSISQGPFTLDVRLKLTMGMMTFAAQCEGPGVLYAGFTVPD